MSVLSEGLKNRKELTPKEVAKTKKRVVNPDGSTSTESGMTVGTEKGYINVPTIVQGKRVSPRTAMKAFKKSGVEPTYYTSLGEAISKSKRRSKAIGIEGARLDASKK